MFTWASLFFLFPDLIPSFSLSTFVLSEGLTCRVIPRDYFARLLENNYRNITCTLSWPSRRQHFPTWANPNHIVSIRGGFTYWCRLCIAETLSRRLGGCLYGRLAKERLSVGRRKAFVLGPWIAFRRGVLDYHQRGSQWNNNHAAKWILGSANVD